MASKSLACSFWILATANGELGWTPSDVWQQATRSSSQPKLFSVELQNQGRLALWATIRLLVRQVSMTCSRDCVFEFDLLTPESRRTGAYERR